MALYVHLSIHLYAFCHLFHQLQKYKHHLFSEAAGQWKVKSGGPQSQPFYCLSELLPVMAYQQIATFCF